MRYTHRLAQDLDLYTFAVYLNFLDDRVLSWKKLTFAVSVQSFIDTVLQCSAKTAKNISCREHPISIWVSTSLQLWVCTTSTQHSLALLKLSLHPHRGDVVLKNKCNVNLSLHWSNGFLKWNQQCSMTHPNLFYHVGSDKWLLCAWKCGWSQDDP